MYAVEFEADAVNGIIKIPEKHKNLYSKHLKLIALIDDLSKVNSSTSQTDWKNVKKQLGWLKLEKDPISWQKEIRNEWDCRK
ncbi:MAG TPA: hypothetical protein DD381_10255 [Lentisphaeria bacterium]|nr:MAG: hypothetical protein A2X47_12030 [Lentisphaerae bacterium GWF2_38_69]HBM16707.1 hypothetical protein [Lentisphaeria bacterium]